MKRLPRWLIMIVVVILAALLAFPLRDTIYEMVVIPLAFIGWEFNLFYRSFHQEIWWWLTIIAVLFMLIFSLLPEVKPVLRKQEKSKPHYGPVENLAIWMGRAQSGIYFKWLIANRLGKLSYQILLHRESGRPRSVFAPLVGVDWEPSKDLQSYLETGLHGSFSDFPTPKRPLATALKTPLDYGIDEAICFLESKLDGNHTSLRRSETNED